MFSWIKSKTSSSRKQLSKYPFHISHSPDMLDSSTTLTLTTYTSTSQSATIPCRYRWSIIKNGLTIQVPEFKGSSFKCQPSDVGAIIQAEVISNDAQYEGTAVIQFGPVRIDLTLKKQIQLALATGSATMPVYLIHNAEEKECQIRLFQDVIKINHAYSQNNYTFDYSIFEPRIQCVSKQSNRMIIIFSEKYQSQLKRFSQRLFQQVPKQSNSIKSSKVSTNSIHSNQMDIKFMNRNSRDIFLFTMKAFNTKKQLKSTTILNKIQKIQFGNEQVFDFVLEIQGLKSQLVKMDHVVKKAHNQKLRYLNEVKRLQKDIQQIILTYTKIVQEKFQNQVQLSKDYSMLSNRRDQIMLKKYKTLQNQNNHLNSRIQTLTKQIDNIRFTPTPQPIITPYIQPPPTIIQQRIQFNYDNVYAFTKKKSNQFDNSGFGNMLDQLGESRISYAGSIKENPQLLVKLEQVEKQKQSLKSKLEMSFHKIDTLEKQIYNNNHSTHNYLSTNNNNLLTNNNNNFSTNYNNSLNNNINYLTNNKNYSTGLKNPIKQQNRLNNSAVNFTYKLNQNTQYLNQALSSSLVQDRQRQNLIEENQKLRKNNQLLIQEKMKLIQQNKNNKLDININNENNHLSKVNLDNSLNFLKTHKKQSISDKQKDLNNIIQKKDNQIKLLKMQNDQLKRSIQKIKKNIDQKQKKSSDQKPTTSSPQYQRLLRKYNELQQQIQMYRKNANALNRSQQLSMQMQNYNQDQIQILKQHNQFLTSQNQKLSKACQKYMNDAKQSNKLRIQIIRLKQKINQLQAQLHNYSTS